MGWLFMPEHTNGHFKDTEWWLVVDYGNILDLSYYIRIKENRYPLRTMYFLNHNLEYSLELQGSDINSLKRQAVEIVTNKLNNIIKELKRPTIWEEIKDGTVAESLILRTGSMCLKIKKLVQGTILCHSAFDHLIQLESTTTENAKKYLINQVISKAETVISQITTPIDSLSTHYHY